MESVFLHVLEQGSACAVHDAFRSTCGSRREQDEQRMVEREHPIGVALVGVHLEIREPVARPRAVRERSAIQGDQRLQAREPTRDVGDVRTQVGRVRAVGVGEVRKEELRLQLLESRQDRHRAHLGRGARERGADCCGGDRSHHHFGIVAGDRDDTIARADADRSIARGHGERALAELPPRDPLDLPRNMDRDNRDRVGGCAALVEQTVEVAEPELGEEDGPLDVGRIGAHRCGATFDGEVRPL